MKRKYLHRIQVNNVAITKDSSGGDVFTPVVLGNSWCSIKSVKRDKIVNYGLDIQSKVIEIETRWRSDLDYEQQGLYLTYKGLDYQPLSIEKVDLEEEVIKIIAVGNSKGA